MREKIASIYCNKAFYYTEVLDSFDEEGIEYVLLNVLVSDDTPGDLDILIVNQPYKTIKRVLARKGFLYYTKYETGQYIWNKYINSIGFVQIHCYMKFAFHGKDYLKGYLLSNNDSNSLLFQFYVFLIESYFKGKRRDIQFEEYKNRSSEQDVLSLAKSVSRKSFMICSQMMDVYDNNKEIIHHHNRLFSIGRLLRRFKGLIKRKDRRVLFIGVDGAGKSSIVDGVYNVFSKGGIFPKKVYLGLRNSRFNRTIPQQEDSNEPTHICAQSSHLSHKGVFRIIKLLLYWCEYNLRYLSHTCIPNSADTVFLIDRCYIDLLRYYHSGIAKWLFLKASLYPKKIVFLTGGKDIIYERKKEFSKEEFDRIYAFYSNIREHLNNENASYLLMDTTAKSLKESIYEVCNYIMK